MFLEAIGYFDIALAIDPENVNAFIGKGMCHILLDDVKQAIKRFNRVLEIDPKNTDALIFKGHMLCRLDKYEDVIAYYDAIIAIEPKNYSAIDSCEDAHVMLSDMKYDLERDNLRSKI